MKKIPSLKRELVRSLQIPKDLALQESLVTLSGSSEILVENYRRILEYEENIIRILLKKGRMRIEGEHLCIAYYSRDEMKITGFIQAVFFDR